MPQNLDDYIVSTQPAHRRSELHPHANVICRMKGMGYSWQQMANFLAQTTGRQFHRNTLRDWWLRQPFSQGSTTTSSAPSATHQSEVTKKSDAKCEARLGAVDSLLNTCHGDLPGFDSYERLRG